MRRIFLSLIIGLAAPAPALAIESLCYGTPREGRLENSVPLPSEGENFRTYSKLGSLVGRTHVHSDVAAIVLAAYAALGRRDPASQFVYGETGWPEGGSFAPHRSHQNGLSVDFFVPVRDRTGRSVPLPTPTAMRFGYDIEFDGEGKWEEYAIDFEILAEHLYQLHVAARARGVDIALVILDPRYVPKIHAAPRGQYLRERVRFMKRDGQVRHDEHYHVDFAVPCTSDIRENSLGQTAKSFKSGDRRSPITYPQSL